MCHLRHFKVAQMRNSLISDECFVYFVSKCAIDYACGSQGQRVAPMRLEFVLPPALTRDLISIILKLRDNTKKNCVIVMRLSVLVLSVGGVL